MSSHNCELFCEYKSNFDALMNMPLFQKLLNKVKKLTNKNKQLKKENSALKYLLFETDYKNGKNG